VGKHVRPGEDSKIRFQTGRAEAFANKPPFYQEVLASRGPYAARPSDPGLPVAGNISHLDWTPERTQANAACYYGMISLMDKHIGRILDALEAAGQADNTLVVFSSDHGDLLGDHGLWWKSLVAYDESIRVPFLASLPGRIPAGSRTRAFRVWSTSSQPSVTSPAHRCRPYAKA